MIVELNQTRRRNGPMKSRFDVVVHCNALYFEVSLYRTIYLKYLNNNCEINFIEPSRGRLRVFVSIDIGEERILKFLLEKKRRAST